MWLDSKAVNCPQKWGNFNDGEATHHEHGSSYTDQPWYFIYRLQMWATLPSPDPSISESGC